jgi:hypothetical protein
VEAMEAGELTLNDYSAVSLAVYVRYVKMEKWKNGEKNIFSVGAKSKCMNIRSKLLYNQY